MRDLDRILAGDRDVCVTEIEVFLYGLERAVHCRDDAAVLYFTEVMRRASRGEGFAGLTGYHADITLTFSTGRSCTIRGFVSETDIVLSVPNARPLEYGDHIHRIRLEPPVPKEWKMPFDVFGPSQVPHR